MPIEIVKHARDGSVFVARCSFFDEEGNAVAPTSLSWTLLGPDLAVVNGRTSETVSSPAAVEDIVLTPADVAYADGALRYLILNWEYNSSLGTGLAGREEAEINIDDIVEAAT